MIASGLLLLFSCMAYAQTFRVSGKVVNENREAVERVQVVLRYTGGGRVVAFTQTTETGSFELRKNVDVPLDSLELSFTCLGYTPQTRKIPDSNQPILVELDSKNFELREVVVSAQKIMLRHDTITYLVSSFSAA